MESTAGVIHTLGGSQLFKIKDSGKNIMEKIQRNHVVVETCPRQTEQVGRCSIEKSATPSLLKVAQILVFLCTYRFF